MTQYVAVDITTGEIAKGEGLPDPPDFVGPPTGEPDALEGHTWRPWQERLSFSDAPSPTSVLQWRNEWEAPRWIETAQLADVIALGIDRIDSHADSIRAEVISRQTNTLEYTRAETQARAFKAAGYPPDNVPSSVSSWAEAKHRDNWTAQEAADDIIATADDWYGLLDGIRHLRLIAKEDVRHASTTNDVSARVQQFITDLETLMTGVS